MTVDELMKVLSGVPPAAKIMVVGSDNEDVDAIHVEVRHVFSSGDDGTVVLIF